MERDNFLKRESQLLSEITTLEQQLEHVNRNLEVTKNQVNEIKIDRDRHFQQNESIKMAASGLENNRGE